MTKYALEALLKSQRSLISIKSATQKFRQYSEVQ